MRRDLLKAILNAPPGREHMSLRDYFAAHAPITLEDVLAVGGWRDATVLQEDVGRAAVFAVWSGLRYEYADQMLEARKG